MAYEQAPLIDVQKQRATLIDALVLPDRRPFDAPIGGDPAILHSQVQRGAQRGHGSVLRALGQSGCLPPFFDIEAQDACDRHLTERGAVNGALKALVRVMSAGLVLFTAAIIDIVFAGRFDRIAVIRDARFQGRGSCRCNRGAVEPRVGFSSSLQAQRTDALWNLGGHRLPSNRSCQSTVSKTHRSIVISAILLKKGENESGLKPCASSMTRLPKALSPCASGRATPRGPGSPRWHRWAARPCRRRRRAESAARAYRARPPWRSPAR